MAVPQSGTDTRPPSVAVMPSEMPTAALPRQPILKSVRQNSSVLCVKLRNV